MDNINIMLSDNEDIADVLFRQPLIKKALRSRSLFDDIIQSADFRFCLGIASHVSLSTYTLANCDLSKMPNRKMIIVVIEKNIEESIAKLLHGEQNVYIISRSKHNRRLPQMIVLHVEKEREYDEATVRICIELPRWLKARLDTLKEELCMEYSEIVGLGLGQSGLMSGRWQ